MSDPNAELTNEDAAPAAPLDHLAAVEERVAQEREESEEETMAKLVEEEAAAQQAANPEAKEADAPETDSAPGIESLSPSPEYGFNSDARVRAFIFDGTLENAHAAVIWGSPHVAIHTNRPLGLPDIVTLRVEQGSGQLICYQGQWLVQLGTKFAVIDDADAQTLLVNS